MSYSLKLNHIRKTYREPNGKRVVALSDISLSVEDGEFFVLVGPSGCGKSTLLRIASGLEKSFSGSVTLGSGIDASHISFVFQQFALLPWLTVFQNIELPLLTREPHAASRRKRVIEMLEQFNLDAFAHARPHELSGGMKQRVGIARALITKPRIIFMDEPFSELDSFIAKKLRLELLQVWQSQRPTVIMVTHTISEAIELSDRVAVMSSHPGLITDIVVNTLPRPRDTRTEAFFAFEDVLEKKIIV